MSTLQRRLMVAISNACSHPKQLLHSEIVRMRFRKLLNLPIIEPISCDL